MIDVSKLEAIAADLRKRLPPGTEQLQLGLRNNLKLIAEAIIARMDLVTREEFDAQRAVLAHTRERLEKLEAHLRALETDVVPH